MIFRRFSEPTPAARKNAPNGKQPFDARREPSLGNGTGNGNGGNRPANNAANTATHSLVNQNGPVSPHAVAQARRTPPSTPASNFSGKDQSRKLTVGRDISLNGEIATCDHLIVEGTVKATIKGGKMLEIAESGTYQGVVDIDQADIAGRFEGELIVRGKLVIRPTAIVTGVLYYNRLQVDTGATINAQLNTLIEEPAYQAAPQDNAVHDGFAQTAPVPQQPQSDGRLFSLASLNDEPGFLRANAN